MHPFSVAFEMNMYKGRVVRKLWNEGRTSRGGGMATASLESSG